MYPDVFISPRNYSSYIDVFIYKINGCYIPRWLISNLTRPPQLYNPNNFKLKKNVLLKKIKKNSTF